MSEPCISCLLKTSLSLSASALRRTTHPRRVAAARPFSTTRRTDASLNRIAFRKWLYGPGKSFKQPIPGSTNYLNAYDRQGRLKRLARRSGRTNEPSAGVAAKASRRDDREDVEAEGEAEDINSDEEQSSRAARKANDGPPPESEDDLKPFPLNPFFKSEPVLTPEFRDEIYRRVAVEGQTIREVSLALNVEMARVGAVVRLKTVEQNWVREGKQLMTKYQDTVLDMLPKTPFNPRSPGVPRHEHINALPVHPATQRQIFHPTSESARFTRADASRVFSATLLPPDARIPHPELIAAARDRAAGMKADQVRAAQRERVAGMEAARRDEREARRRREQARTTVVAAPRWDFRIRDVDVEAGVGNNGRGPRGVGWRYGFPHEDRKRGQVKIPTSVD